MKDWKQANSCLVRYLAKKIKHQQDHFEDLLRIPDELDQEYDEDEFGDAEYPTPYEELESEDMDPEAMQVEDELIERMTRRWLDTPDAKGITPRQAAQTAEGREGLEETMKQIEFLEERALRSREKPPMRLDIIRKELGL